METGRALSLNGTALSPRDLMAEVTPLLGRFIAKSGTILAGQSLSNAYDLSAGAPVFIHMDAGWTPSVMSFQVSPDGIQYNDLFDQHSVQLVYNVAAGTSVRLDPKWTPVTFLKVRSGPREAPVPQEANRVITFTLDTSL
jgi:hypothetical protein